MSRIHKLNAIAATVVAGTLGAGLAQAASPFAATDLAGGYQQLAAADAGATAAGKGMEGGCGNMGGDAAPAAAPATDKAKKEGKCAGAKADATQGAAPADKGMEGQCGNMGGAATPEAKPADKPAEGKCGEGKCGEGKCGAGM